MIDRSRHAATGRFRAPRLRGQSRGLPQVYGGRARRSIRDIYDVDHAHGSSNQFRWLISTCVAAAVGVVAIGVVLFGSLNRDNTSDSVLEQLATVQQPTPGPLRLSVIGDGQNWAIPKSDRLQIASSALTARYTIHEQVRVRRNNRPFIQIRPYLRISLRLVPASPTNRDVIPRFNPMRLYAATNSTPADDDKERTDKRLGHIETRVVELLGGILPGDDGQELDAAEVSALVQEANASQESVAPQPALERVGILPGNLTPAYLTEGLSGAAGDQASIAEATTVIYRSANKSDDDGDAALDQSEIRDFRIGRPTPLADILRSMGATTWQNKAMVEAANTIIGDTVLPAGNEVRVRLVPHGDHLEPEAFAVFGPLNQHLVTVKRSNDGVFVAQTEFDPRILMNRATFEAALPSDASLYASVYDAALTQNLPPDEIVKILRIHAYEIDFRKRVRDGDQLELFYELKPQTNGTNKLGELLFAAIANGGSKNRFWRFRSQDGAVEYYDTNGENSKKFLMRKPVRGSNVRLTSGFGYRRHPVLNVRRMHTGADWAAPTGTPILAAGRGIIEEAKRKGTYGNYIRIRHANGYQTTYAHMRRFASGMRPGLKVRQGQVIGYVGTTGLSSGPHLHYEILVNNRFVNPLRIRVPRARKLYGKELAAFQRERKRIEELMRRSPVKTASR